MLTEHNLGLEGQCQDVVKGVEWSTVVNVANICGGRPIGTKDGQRNKSKRIESQKIECIKNSIVGLFNFVNHTCNNHAQFQWDENAVEQKINHLTPERAQTIMKGDQIFINYNEGSCRTDLEYKYNLCTIYLVQPSR